MLVSKDDCLLLVVDLQDKLLSKMGTKINLLKNTSAVSLLAPARVISPNNPSTSLAIMFWLTTPSSNKNL